MFDIFYFGKKPNLFAHEKFANNLEEAGKLSRTKFYWFIYGGNYYSNFDFDFRPPPWEEHQIHIWPNQWQPNGEVYFAPKHWQERVENYHTDTIVNRLPNLECYNIPENVDRTSIDWTWCPDPCSPPYIYVFGNQWNTAINDPTVTYTVPGATQKKFVEDRPVRLLPTMDNWEVLDAVEEFDFSWRPDPTHPPYIYVFGNQWHSPESRPSVKYCVPGGTQYKFIFDPIVKRKQQPDKFVTLANCEFDYSWEPDPGSPPYIYIFGNQHWPPEILPTVKYAVAGATEIKYIDEPRAQLTANKDNWHSLTELPFDFDYSWCPDPGDPPYIYQFGNQWYPAEVMPTVEYRVAGATEIKYVDVIQARLLPVMERWSVPEEVDSANIDFSWTPHPKDDPYIHHFGSDYQISTGLTYTVPGATEPKFEGEAPRLVQDKNVVAVVDIFYIDKGNSLSNSRYDKLKENYPGIQKVRYANSMMETIKRCVTRSRTRKFWVISSLNIYDDFDFAWHAEPWQNHMTHVFPSQWNKWSDTFLINKYEFERHSGWAKGVEEFPNLNFVKNQTVLSSSDGSNIYYVDHGNATEQLSILQTKYSKIKVTRFVDNYLDTFKRIMTTADTEYVWIINSICDYRQFDFTWHPEAWQSEMIHVFPSGTQKRGDTFYIHVESFKKQIYDLELLDWFNVVNYCDDQAVQRCSVPEVVYDSDSIVDVIKSTTFDFPYAIFVNKQDTNLTYPTSPCLWAVKDREIVSLNQTNSSALIPRDAKSFVKKQVYDYPYIRKIKQSKTFLQDIIFISYDEPQADLNWGKLSSKFNAVRLHGVKGMHNALVAAANKSRTPWFYAVFAKTEIAETFDFTFNPDYFQQPKHYIFHARNVLNKLEYGHMGVVLYNCNLVKNQTKFGIDYTMSAPHAVIPELSAIASFNSNPYHTWRTAFRECAKLAQFIEEQQNIENEYRLDTWLSVANGNHAEWCLRGARDGYEFYQANKTKPAVIQQAFDWTWLQKHFELIYSDINCPDLTVLEQRQESWLQQKHC